ncbi:hypothetical protein M6B38_306915 [Iris pallida]|uniref:Uncharacterized protein n=1 Tax=Iris pallida TaxID=29817 RepID=A0AAX6HKQ9_IRIPA|nr:hypothetical protein M6B38_213350 [Iris pallida]KAJ6841332.1 hypothetical protein M6B38_306915 [Iris pallida]
MVRSTRRLSVADGIFKSMTTRLSPSDLRRCGIVLVRPVLAVIGESGSLMATRRSPEALVTLSSYSSLSLQRLVMMVGGGSRLSVGRRETVEREDVERERV